MTVLSWRSMPLEMGWLMQADIPTRPLRPGLAGAFTVYVFLAAGIARTVLWTETDIRSLLPYYLGLELTFLSIFTLTLWWPPSHRGWLHLIFVLQSGIILGLLSLYSHLDFLTIFFIVLSYQAALVFTGRIRWAWIGIFILLLCGSLMYFKGALKGLSLAITPLVGCIIFPAYIIAAKEIETARKRSQEILKELQEKNRHLREYAGRVEELTALEERNRLAMELHHSVSKALSGIIFDTQSAQILLKHEPERVRPALEKLQEMTQNTLTEMRNLIDYLRL
jgi:signal transduction histidine kinase